jgi:hypothetical protein
VLSGDSVSYNGSGGRIPEPLFRDAPFDESEWRALYDILRQVNQPKAELMRVQYEAVRTAYQHYAAARAEERDAYAVQRVADEAYNREVAAQRQAVEAQMREARERWRPTLTALRTALEQARLEAYLRAGEAGLNLRGGAFLGIGLDDAEPSAHDAPQTAQPSPPAPTTRLPDIRAATPLPARIETPYEPSAARDPWLPAAPPEPPFSAEEAAHEARLPTAQPRTAFRWLHWLAPIVVGLLLGLLTLTAFGVGLTDWQNPLVWIAPLAGALAMLVWYRALWNASRALSELYYLFNWGADQARRVAWLAGAAVLAVLLSPIAVLLSALSFAPSVWNTPAPMAALLALVMMLPLAGLALTGGYFHGRQEVVANAVRARVNAEQRAHARETRERHDSRMPPRAEPTDAPTHATSPNAVASPNRDGTPAHAPTPTAIADPQERLRTAFTAIANARAAEANYQHAKQELENELAPLQQELLRLQPRPIYPDLPPHAQERLRALYQQWRLAYTALLDYVAEAARECKDGEQIAQRIAAFKDALLR